MVCSKGKDNVPVGGNSFPSELGSTLKEQNLLPNTAKLFFTEWPTQQVYLDLKVSANFIEFLNKYQVPVRPLTYC